MPSSTRAGRFGRPRRSIGMSDTLSTSLDCLEVSTFSQELFAKLSLATIGDLTSTSERRFLAEARVLARETDRPDDFPAKSLREVKEILADMGLRLKPEIPGGSYDALYASVRAEAERAAMTTEDVEAQGKAAIAIVGPLGRIVIQPNFREDGVSFQHQVDRSDPAAQAFVQEAMALYERAAEGA